MSKSLPGLILVGFFLLLVGTASLIVMLGERKEAALHELLSYAQASRDQGEPREAAELYQQALQLAPHDPNVPLALFDLYFYFEPEKGGGFLKQAEEALAAPEALLYRRLRLNLYNGDLDAAREAVKRLDSMGTKGREAQLARLLFLFAENKLSEALVLLGGLGEAFPQDRQVSLLTASFQAGVDGIVNKVQAKNRFLNLLETYDEYSFRAAVNLLLPSALPLYPEDQEQAAEHLASHPFLVEGLSRLDTEALRYLASHQVESQPATAFLFCNELIGRENTTPDDRLLWIYAGQAAGELDQVRRAVEEIERGDTKDSKRLILVARQHALNDNFTEALDVIAGIEALNSDSVELRAVLEWFLATQSVKTGDSDKVRLAELILELPEADPDLYLSACNLLLLGDPSRKEDLVDIVVQHFKHSNNLIPVALWLNQQEAFDRVEDLVPHSSALSDQASFLVLANALIGKEDYSAAHELLEESGSLLKPWQIDLFKARLFHLQGVGDATSESLQQAMHELPPEARANLFQIADLARQAGDAAGLEEALALAYRYGLVFPQHHAMDYLRILMDSGDLEASLRFASYCYNLQPEVPGYLNNLSYLRLISGQAIGQCIEDMKDLVQQYPENVYFRLTLSLGELLGGYPGLARDTIESFNPPVSELAPRSALIYAVVMAGTGNREAASPMIKHLDLDSLLDPEQALVNRFFRDGEL